MKGEIDVRLTGKHHILHMSDHTIPISLSFFCCNPFPHIYMLFSLRFFKSSAMRSLVMDGQVSLATLLVWAKMGGALGVYRRLFSLRIHLLENNTDRSMEIDITGDLYDAGR